MVAKTLYRRAADDGLIFGIYITILSILSMLSTTIELLSIPVLLMIAGVPAIIFIFLRKMYVSEFGLSRFSALWMLGILIFIFGSLICGMATYIYLQYIEPNYIYSTMQKALELAQSNPDKNSDVANILQEAIKQKMIPSPIQVVMQMIWFTALTGSILSAILSSIVRATKVKTTNI